MTRSGTARTPSRLAAMTRRGVAKLSPLWTTLLRRGPIILRITLIGAYSILALSQWFHLDGNDAKEIYESDRGGGGAQSERRLYPRDPRDIWTEEDPIRLSFVIEKLDLENQVLRGSVFARLDAEIYRRKYPLAEELPTSISLGITGLSTRRVTRVPLADARDTDSPIDGVPVEFEAWGHSNDFPSDAYGSNNFTSLGSGVGFPSIEVVIGGGMSAYKVTAAADETYLNFFVERHKKQAWWVYIIALSPLFLFIALQRARRGSDTLQTTSLEIAVGVLALLPLRQVLVPPEIPTLTRVDVLLGLELLGFLLWVAFAVGQRPPGRRRSGSRDGWQKYAAGTMPARRRPIRSRDEG
jgi:hypothetical protein